MPSDGRRYLIVVGTSPTRVGISQFGDKLWAMSPCCDEQIAFNWVADYDWDCSKCKKEIEDCELASTEWNDVTAANKDLVAWVTEWTGFKKSQVDIKKTRGEKA